MKKLSFFLILFSSITIVLSGCSSVNSVENAVSTFPTSTSHPTEPVTELPTPTNTPTNAPTPTEVPVKMVKKRLSQTRYGNGVASSIEEYKYDERGNQISVITTNLISGKVTKTIESQFDALGREILVTTKDTNGTTVSTYEYNGLSVIIKDEKYSWNGTLIDTIERYQEFDERGNIVYYKTPTEETTMRYDDNNLHTETITLLLGTSEWQKSRTVYQYTEDGYTARIDTYLGDEKKPSSTATYEYERSGNCLYRIGYRNGKPDVTGKYELEDDGTWSKYYLGLNGQPDELFYSIEYGYIPIIDETAAQDNDAVPSS